MKLYAYMRDPHTGKRVPVHRWLVEQALGRPLLPGEVVHGVALELEQNFPLSQGSSSY